MLYTCVLIIIGEYGGWVEALEHGDFRSVFVFGEPLKVPLHNFYEFIWFLKTGGPRLVRLYHNLPNVGLTRTKSFFPAAHVDWQGAVQVQQGHLQRRIRPGLPVS